MERGELHETVARVIAEVYCGTGGMASGGTHGDLLADRAAAAAIGVVLAEAGRSVEALPVKGQWAAERMQVEALAVLTALGEHA